MVEASVMGRKRPTNGMPCRLMAESERQKLVSSRGTRKRFADSREVPGFPRRLGVGAQPRVILEYVVVSVRTLEQRHAAIRAAGRRTVRGRNHRWGCYGRQPKSATNKIRQDALLTRARAVQAPPLR